MTLVEQRRDYSQSQTPPEMVFLSGVYTFGGAAEVSPKDYPELQLPKATATEHNLCCYFYAYIEDKDGHMSSLVVRGAINENRDIALALTPETVYTINGRRVKVGEAKAMLKSKMNSDERTAEGYIQRNTTQIEISHERGTVTSVNLFV